MSRDDFEMLNLIGKGAFGEVSSKIYGQQRQFSNLAWRFMQLLSIFPLYVGRRCENEEYRPSICFENAKQMGNVKKSRGSSENLFPIYSLRKHLTKASILYCDICRLYVTFTSWLLFSERWFCVCYFLTTRLVTCLVWFTVNW